MPPEWPRDLADLASRGGRFVAKDNDTGEAIGHQPLLPATFLPTNASLAMNLLP